MLVLIVVNTPTSAIVKSKVVWDVTFCEGVYRRCGGVCCLFLQIL